MALWSGRRERAVILDIPPWATRLYTDRHLSLRRGSPVAKILYMAKRPASSEVPPVDSELAARWLLLADAALGRSTAETQVESADGMPLQPIEKKKAS